MAKGQQRSSREKRKPKKEKVKPAGVMPRLAAFPAPWSNSAAGARKS